jgi:hypothetical protein
MSGASANEIERVIRQRLTVWKMWDALVEKHGEAQVECAISSAARFYEGVEEIGSSDASYMVDSAVRQLGEPTIFKDQED